MSQDRKFRPETGGFYNKVGIAEKLFIFILTLKAYHTNSESPGVLGNAVRRIAKGNAKTYSMFPMWLKSIRPRS